MPLTRCMEEHTERQLEVWLVWLKRQWNEPSRTDWYLMALRAEVRNLFAKQACQPKDLKLEFSFEAQVPKRKITQAEMDAYETGIWLAFAGIDPSKPGEYKKVQRPQGD